MTGAAVIAVFLAAESYRLERLAIWRNPEKYEKGFRPFRDFMLLEAAGFSEEDLAADLQKTGLRSRSPE